MRYYYKDNKGNLYNFKSEHFVKYKEKTITLTPVDKEGNPFLDENGEPMRQTMTTTVRDGLQEGYTEITEEEFNKRRKLLEPTEEQKAKAEKARKIAELKRKLSATDYIVLKIAEAQAYGEAEKVSALKTTYAAELSQREEWREQINAIETA